jgi:hypothetical protein
MIEQQKVELAALPLQAPEAHNAQNRKNPLREWRPYALGAG